MTAIDDRISALETKLRQAKQQKQQAENKRLAAEKKRARERDTRRKVLVGAMLLWRVDSGKFTQEKLQAMMGDFLTRADERALFDLQPIPTEAPQEPSES